MTQKVTVELVLEIDSELDADEVVSAMDYEVKGKGISYSEIRGISSIIDSEGNEVL